MGKHILHYLGHGGFHKEHGEFLVLKGQRCLLNDATDTLGAVFSPAQNKSLRLVTLNACLLESQGRVATRLVELGVPATVGMRCRIGMDTVTGFTEAFYKEIGYGKSVDAAFHEAVFNTSVSRYVESFIPMLVLGTEESMTLVKRVESDESKKARELLDNYRDRRLNSYEELMNYVKSLPPDNHRLIRKRERDEIAAIIISHVAKKSKISVLMDFDNQNR